MSDRKLNQEVVETVPGRHELRTDNPWEAICGHTRAVRCGSSVIVAGTTASAVDGGCLHPESAYHQSLVIFQRIRDALIGLGAQMTDVVRVRMFISDMDDQVNVCRAFKETFSPHGIRVPATLVQVSAFVHPDMRVEIEADAIILLKNEEQN